MLALLLALFMLPPPMPDPLVFDGHGNALIGIDGALVLVWYEGLVTRSEDIASAGSVPPLLGEVIGRDVRFDAPAGARVRILVAGDRLLALDGPGAWFVGSGRIQPIISAEHPSTRAPRMELLTTYREGPLPTLESGSSQPLLDDMTLPPTLLVTEPIAPVTRHDRIDIRWHWPYPGGRFDLVLELLNADGQPLRTVERWTNLAGRVLPLWAPLERGQRYRVRIAHRADDGASPIVDRREFHVLGPSEIAAVDGALASLDELQNSPKGYRPEIDVLRARLLESHGLWDEAEAVWTGLTLLYPGRDDLLHQALRLHAKSMARPL